MFSNHIKDGWSDKEADTPVLIALGEGNSTRFKDSIYTTIAQVYFNLLQIPLWLNNSNICSIPFEIHTPSVKD